MRNSILNRSSSRMIAPGGKDMARIRESWEKKIRRRRSEETPETSMIDRPSHDLVLGDAASRLSTLHHVPGTRTGTGVQILDESDAQRATAVLVAGELGCRDVSMDLHWRRREDLPIAVSAVSALSNSTTPVPRERPLGSYWISAFSTLPMVEKRSIRSSLQVDHGSCLCQCRAVTPIVGVLTLRT